MLDLLVEDDEANRVFRINELAANQHCTFQVTEWHAFHGTTDVPKKDGHDRAPSIFLAFPQALCLNEHLAWGRRKGGRVV